MFFYAVGQQTNTRNYNYNAEILVIASDDSCMI